MGWRWSIEDLFAKKRGSRSGPTLPFFLGKLEGPLADVIKTPEHFGVYHGTVVGMGDD